MRIFRQYLPIIVGGLMVFGYQNCAPLGDSLSNTSSSQSGSGDGTTQEDPNNPPPPPPPPPPGGNPPPTELVCTTSGSPSLANENAVIFTVYSGHGSTDSGHSGSQTFRADIGGTTYSQMQDLTDETDSANALNNIAGNINNGRVSVNVQPDGQRTCRSGTSRFDVQIGANCTLPANEPSRVSNIISVTVNVINACMTNATQDGPALEGQPQFGHDVAIQSNRIAVASLRDSSDGGFNSYHGAIHIYNRSGTTTSLQQRLVPSDIAAGDSNESRRDGGTMQSLAMDGNLVAVGLPRSGNRMGAVYVFSYNGANWTQRDRILPPAGSNQAYFGQSVALEGTRLVVGAMEEAMGGVARGAVYVYNYSGGNWNLSATLQSSSPMDFEHFGEDVAIDNGNIVVGAPFSDLRKDDGRGSVYYFAAGNYGSSTKISTTNAAVGSQFGRSVAISGNRIVIGAPTDGGGAAFVFNRTSLNNAPLQLQSESGQFGYSVAVDGANVLVGAKSHTTRRGAVFYYDLNKYQSRIGANQKAYFQLSGRTSEDQFGTSVALDGGFGVVGAPLVKVGIYNQSGAATVYELKSANY